MGFAMRIDSHVAAASVDHHASGWSLAEDPTAAQIVPEQSTASTAPTGPNVGEVVILTPAGRLVVALDEDLVAG